MIINLTKETNTEKELRLTLIEQKNALPYSSLYLDGKIDILKQLIRNDINIPLNMVSNYDIKEVV